MIEELDEVECDYSVGSNDDTFDLDEDVFGVSSVNNTIVVNGAMLDKYGFNCVGWVSAIADFASASIYKNRLYDFVIYHECSSSGTDVSNESIVKSMIGYFDFKHSELNSKGF